ncbi:MAG: pyridoxal-dependent decarboxylase [Pseudobdellovibrionaceae bacterium]
MSHAELKIVKAQSAGKLSLPAKIHPAIEGFLNANQDTIFNLADAFGSPLNIMFPQVISENIAAFQNIYKKHGITGRVFFTSKPNKSQAVIRQAAMQDVNVDVSSEQALKNILGYGFDASRIECTGPKNSEYLTLAVQQGTIINADNMEEIDRALALHETLGKQGKLRVFLRLCGFHSDRVKFTSQDGTFGVHVDRADEMLAFLQERIHKIDFLGFSYYWSGASQEQRMVAIENGLQLTLRAVEMGLAPKGLNIGGGFHVQYAADRESWLRYIDNVKLSLRDTDSSMTWNDNGLGYRNEGGIIKGAPNYMDHCAPYTGAADFDQLLQLPLAAFDGMTAADILRDCMLDLYIEPGRALLDQCGVTMGRVNFTKPSTHGETLVALDMNRSNMHSTHQKLLTDPIVLYRDEASCDEAETGVYYYGNLCVSYDIITYQKSFPRKLPKSGDLVIFVNTAPYIMDFIESETLHQNTAEKVAIIQDGENYRWFKDAKYRPLEHNPLSQKQEG